MNNQEHHGLLIAMEGGEGAGKTTLMSYLRHELQKMIPVTAYREPGGTPFSEDIRNIFFNYPNLSVETAVHLINAQRKDNIEHIVQPAINQSKMVIVDRFIASTLVYQGILNNQYKTVDRLIDDYPMVTIFIDVPPEIGLKRIADNNRDTNHFDEMTIEKHHKIYNGYKELAYYKPDQYWDVVIDGTKPIDELREDMRQLAKQLVKLVNSHFTLSEIKNQLRIDYNGLSNRILSSRYIRYSEQQHGSLSIDELGLSTSITERLKSDNIHTLSDLMNQPIATICTIHGIGLRKEDEIDAKLTSWFAAVSPKPKPFAAYRAFPRAIDSNKILIDQHISQMKLNTRAENILLRNGLTTISKLVNTSPKDFNNLHRMGDKSRTNILRQLNQWSIDAGIPITMYPLSPLLTSKATTRD